MFKNYFILSVVLCLMTGCYPTLNTQGNLLDMAVVKQLLPGRSTKSEIREALGPPTSTNLFVAHDTWYYMGEKTEKTSFFNPKVVERLIVEITFDKNGVMTASHIYELKDGYNLTPDSTVTPTYGRDPGFLADVFGGFGKYEAPGAGRRKK